MGFEPATSGIIVEPVMALPLGHSRARDTLRFNNHYHLLKSDKNSQSYGQNKQGDVGSGLEYKTIARKLLKN